ncbi:transposase [Streptosporangium canum]|uniref:transposase n=1 Tax=Streptosporangium canum TaxID=324952 RepID=UPI0037B2EA08
MLDDIHAAFGGPRPNPRRAMLTYLRWRNSLPDLSAVHADQVWRRFVDAHEGRCGLCREFEDGGVIDHDHTTRKSYPSDLTDAQWALIEPALMAPRCPSCPGGR